MNAARRRANLRMDQLRRRLHRGEGDPFRRMQWKAYIRADREPRPLHPLGAQSWIIRCNLRGRDGSHETDAYVRDYTRRTLAAYRNRQPPPII